MAEHELARLIPWYANGTLPPDESVELERHLKTCADCRALLEQARTNRELAAGADATRHLEHVDPRLLTQYAESPGSLDDETIAWIESRLRACADCREALARLEEVAASLSASRAADKPSLLRRLWDGLAGSVLQPVPALAYLLALFAVVSWYGWFRGPDGTLAPPIGDLSAIAVDADRAWRSDEPVPPEEVLELPAGTVVLEARTDLDAEDVVRAERFEAELLLDGEVVSRQRLDADGFLIPVVLHADALLAGRDYVLVIRFVGAGHPLDGQPFFRKTLRRTGKTVPSVDIEVAP